jgi:hypothetical protein
MIRARTMSFIVRQNVKQREKYLETLTTSENERWWKISSEIVLGGIHFGGTKGAKVPGKVRKSALLHCRNKYGVHLVLPDLKKLPSTYWVRCSREFFGF